MIDTNIYRSRIGLFSQKVHKKKFLYKTEYYKQFSETENHSGKNTMLVLHFIFKFALFLGILLPISESYLATSGQCLGMNMVCSGSGVVWEQVHYWGGAWATIEAEVGGQDVQGVNYVIILEILDHNFLARYVNGNIQKKKGILNMHLNVRSLRFKVYEVKQIIKEHNPHILGISESELKKDRVDEKCLKIPGYDLLFPKSWSQHGFARVVVYVKKTFKYQQISELEDDQVQLFSSVMHIESI